MRITAAGARSETRSPAKTKAAATKTAADDEIDKERAAHDRALAIEKMLFDFAADERAELARERDVLQSFTLAQIKSGDDFMHKLIELM